MPERNFHISKSFVFHVIIAVVLVTSGTINTVFAKLTDSKRAKGTNPEDEHSYDHPFFQVSQMFLGELLCLIAFEMLKYFKIKQPQLEEDEEEQRIPPPSPFIWIFPAICDFTSTSLLYFGLTWTFASSFQMLRGSVIIFTGLLSVAFLKTKLYIHHWIGIGFIVLGLVLVGIGDYIYGKVYDVDIRENYLLASDLLIVISQIVTAIQMIIEEKLLKKYKVPPLQAVGWEGLFGFVIVCLLLLPMYLVPWHVSFSVVSQTQPRFEDIADAITMIGNNLSILVCSLVVVVSIAVFNFAGLTVTITWNATTRMVLDNARTVSIWIVSLIFKWEKAQPLQPIGYILLLMGILIYYDIIICPILRWMLRYVQKPHLHQIYNSQNNSDTGADVSAISTDDTDAYTGFPRVNM